MFTFVFTLLTVLSLGSENYSVRETAEKALLDAPNPVVKACLLAALDHPDLEVRRRSLRCLNASYKQPFSLALIQSRIWQGYTHDGVHIATVTVGKSDNPANPYGTQMGPAVLRMNGETGRTVGRFGLFANYQGEAGNTNFGVRFETNTSEEATWKLDIHHIVTEYTARGKLRISGTQLYSSYPYEYGPIIYLDGPP